MDTFMDKLAQKFTAQEMIKANAAADAEEMKRLQEQVQEYSGCLDRMQEVCRQVEQAAGAAQEKINGAKVDEEQLNRLVDAGIAKIQEIQQDTKQLEALKKQLEELKKQMEESRAAQGAVEEIVHRECVRTYRNVQAVVNEESAKQTENINGAFQKVKGRLAGVLGVSVAALAISLVGVVFQVLVWLHII